MAMNKDSNAYTILFSVVLVIVMGVSLALVAQFTAPFQEKNMKLEKMQNILSSIGVNYGKTSDPDDIEYERANTEVEFPKYITEAYVYDMNGNIQSEAKENIEQSEAFKLDLAYELKKPIEEQKFPLFVANKNGQKLYIVPMRGTGLWDAIWGFVSIQEDGKTIAGASFDHKGETPGLGAEIKEKAFQKQFIGKTFYDAQGNFSSIKVVKPGKVAPDSPQAKYSVDGISGGTLTSNGVDAMLNKYFTAFDNYMHTVGTPTAAN